MAENYNSEYLIDRFIELRKRKHMSQAAVASKADLHQAAVGRIENKSTNPQMETMLKLLDTMGYTLAIVPSGDAPAKEILLEIFSKIESFEEKSIKRIKAYVDALYEDDLNRRLKAFKSFDKLCRPIDIDDDYKTVLEEELIRKYESID